MKRTDKIRLFFGWNKQYENNYERIFRKSLKERIQELIDNILVYIFLK